METDERRRIRVIHNFQDDHAIGVRGEAVFKSLLEKWKCNYEDVTDDPKYQEQDVDFIVESRKDANKKIMVEVKNDQRIADTGNIFFETMSNVDYSTVGCFKKSKADLMAIVSEEEKVVYFIETETLRDFVNENSASLRFISRVPGSNSCGYLVPLKSVRKDVIAVRY